MIMQVFFTTSGAAEDSGRGKAAGDRIHRRVCTYRWKLGRLETTRITTFWHQKKKHLKCLAGSSRADDEVDDCCFSQ
jgi:hypothetical protein